MTLPTIKIAGVTVGVVPLVVTGALAALMINAARPLAAGPPAVVAPHAEPAADSRTFRDLCEAQARASLTHPETYKANYFFAETPTRDGDGWAWRLPFVGGNSFGEVGHFIADCTTDARGAVRADIGLDPSPGVIAMIDLDTRVSHALRTAAANGYDLSNWSDRRVAEDMQTYSADLEDEALGALMRAIARVRGPKAFNPEGRELRA